MPAPRYPQFCALARAAEMLGERWTLLIVRDLLLGPRRFSDLRRGVDGVSTSVLTERLEHLEAAGLVRRAYLEPPAASRVYELTPDGAALRPAVHELIRWGARRLLPPRPDERVDPSWVGLALEACAARSSVPARRLEVRLPGERRATRLRVVGGPRGTTVEATPPDGQTVEATLVADPRSVLALASGALSIADALAQGRLTVEGDRRAADDFSTLFDVALGGETDDGHPRPA